MSLVSIWLYLSYLSYLSYEKIHRADRIHSISYNKLYLSFLLYWAFVREVSIKLYLSYEFFSYDVQTRKIQRYGNQALGWRKPVIMSSRNTIIPQSPGFEQGRPENRSMNIAQKEDLFAPGVLSLNTETELVFLTFSSSISLDRNVKKGRLTKVHILSTWNLRTETRIVGVFCYFSRYIYAIVVVFLKLICLHKTNDQLPSSWRV